MFFVLICKCKSIVNIYWQAQDHWSHILLVSPGILAALSVVILPGFHCVISAACVTDRDSNAPDAIQIVLIRRNGDVPSVNMFLIDAFPI